jgi:Tfp pilus assembly protein PilX
VGLPPDEFQLAYAAGYDIAAAERCGETIDAGLVRYNLVQDIKRRGMDDAVASKAGHAFDKTRSEFARKLQSRPDYCVTEYALSRDTLALYRKGEFSTAR